MKILKYLFYLLLIIVLLGAIGGAYIYNFKPDVGAAPDLQIEKTAARVERGKYLANNVTVCMDCHSRRNWAVFSGPIHVDSEGGGGEVFGRTEGFPGTIYSTNITPYKMESWSDGEIYRAVTAGVAKDGRALFPVMGYHRFGQMDKEDIFSIIAYIRTLPAISSETPAPELDFPVNVLNKLEPQLAKHQKIPEETDLLKYGGYLINAAGCVVCHSKQEKGKIIAGTEFAGGMEFRQPAGIIRAPNITPHVENGIGNWTEDFFIEKFKIYSDSTFSPPEVHKGELNSPMPWTMYTGMTRHDLKAIYAYLKSLPPKDVLINVREFNK